MPKGSLAELGVRDLRHGDNHLQRVVISKRFMCTALLSGRCCDNLTLAWLRSPPLHREPGKFRPQHLDADAPESKASDVVSAFSKRLIPVECS